MQNKNHNLYSISTDFQTTGREPLCSTGRWRLPARLAIVAAGLLLTGCASVSGYPERTTEVDQRLESLQEMYFLPQQDVLDTYANLRGADRQSYRNEVVYARMMALDLQFSVFREQLYEEGTVSNLSLDILGLAAGAAGAITTGSQASRILSALSGGIAGADSSINKNLYFERTMPALLAMMEAEREKIRTQIIEGLQQDDAKYQLGQALIDLERYFQVGSIPGAIASVTEKAGETSSKAKSDQTIVRTAAFVNPAAQVRVGEALGLVETLAAGKAWEILNAPPTPIDAVTQTAITGRLGGRSIADAEASLTGANEANAKALLRMVLVNLEDRSEAGIGKWITLMQSFSE